MLTSRLVVPQSTANDSSVFTPDQSRKLILYQLTRQVSNIDTGSLRHEGSCFCEIAKGEWQIRLCSFEEIRVFADNSERHGQVHQSTGIVIITNSCLLNEIYDADMVSKVETSTFLSQVADDVSLDGGRCRRGRS